MMPAKSNNSNLVESADSKVWSQATSKKNTNTHPHRAYCACTHTVRTYRHERMKSQNKLLCTIKGLDKITETLNSVVIHGFKTFNMPPVHFHTIMKPW